MDGVTFLSRSTLRDEAGDIVFGRGESYVGHVRGLVLMGTCATAVVQATSAYVVELDWSGRRLRPECTCPHFDRGHFCKHLVAVGLAALATGNVEESASDPERLAPSSDPKALSASVSVALNFRGAIDYWSSSEVAGSAHVVLDQLEDRLDGGEPDVVRAALLRALTRIRAISLRADDSNGEIGGACQRAADLYSRSCREGSPDPVKLARWLVKFRADSPGWPETPLADFVEAFDERGLQVYRTAVDKLDEEHPGVDHWRRFDVDRMLLELADHDGDVDGAITILSSGEHPDYRGIADRLRAADRPEEMMAWIDRAVETGRISTSHGRGPYWLDPAEVAEAYLVAGRTDEAIQMLRDVFVRMPSLTAFTLLMSYAKRLGREPAERERALETARALARQHSFSSGGLLIEIALVDKDLDAAWAAAEQFGAGNQWQQLAKASERVYPRRAAGLYLPGIESTLRHPDSKVYPEVAKNLARMKVLYERAGDSEGFAALIGQIRASYARRPALMRALDRQRL